MWPRIRLFLFLCVNALPCLHLVFVTTKFFRRPTIRHFPDKQPFADTRHTHAHQRLRKHTHTHTDSNSLTIYTIGYNIYSLIKDVMYYYEPIGHILFCFDNRRDEKSIDLCWSVGLMVYQFLGYSKLNLIYKYPKNMICKWIVWRQLYFSASQG